jgi:hypothetical protein
MIQLLLIILLIVLILGAIGPGRGWYGRRGGRL